MGFRALSVIAIVTGWDIVGIGAHSGCMSSDKLHLVKVTDTNPNRRVKVANGALLKVIAIGDLTLQISNDSS